MVITVYFNLQFLKYHGERQISLFQNLSHFGFACKYVCVSFNPEQHPSIVLQSFRSKTMRFLGRHSLLDGMTRSVYLTHLITMCAVSLNDRRMSCAFYEVLRQAWERRNASWFLLPYVMSVLETTGEDPNNDTRLDCSYGLVYSRFQTPGRHRSTWFEGFLTTTL